MRSTGFDVGGSLGGGDGGADEGDEGCGELHIDSGIVIRRLVNNNGTFHRKVPRGHAGTISSLVRNWRQW